MYSTGLIRCFALHNLCDLNPTSWAASVAQLVRTTALKARGRGFESHLSSLFLKTEKRALRFVALFAFKSLSSLVPVFSSGRFSISGQYPFISQGVWADIPSQV